MVTVAIAGGGTGIGYDILRAIISTKKHNVIVLSRSMQPHLDSLGVSVRVVDYFLSELLKQSLQDVHTVISCIAAYGKTSTAAELALLKAAKAAGVTRFVPSEWNGDCHDIVDLYSGKSVVWQAVQTSGLEYTRFLCGLWMNVWGPGCVQGEEEATGAYGARPPFAIDLKARTAIIPGHATQKLVVTRTQDVGKFVAAALDRPNWPAETKVGGDRLSLSEAVELGTLACGSSFQIMEVNVEDLNKVLQRDLPEDEKIYYQLLLAIARGRLDFEPESSTLFPAITPLTTAEYFQRHWTSK